MAHRPAIIRICNQMKLKVSQELVSDKHVKVILPAGFPFIAYNGKGYVNPWNILTLLDTFRITVFAKSTPNEIIFLDGDKLCEESMPLICATTAKISPSLYDNSIAQAPMEMHCELTHAGKTSMTMKYSLYFKGSDLPVCENKIKTVSVDLTSRKPYQLPDWWKKKYDIGLEGGQTLNIPRIVPGSSVLYNYQVKVKASDLDFFWHVNWSNYVKFSLDCFIEFAAKEHGPGNLVRAFRKCKNFSVLFLKEARLMDTLDICMWKDLDNPNLFKFQFKNEADVACESHLEFYPHDE
ncbi:hypothetical protein PoB_003793000 [Plakobranchus ocellatus]|uniref:Acyl-ACP thioesterase-like C-terminal domain-containing protein n=1 Tax=Plakobranchus ocellatus TaxID=259542 RepID=A0AAV4ASW1_9GAST|nr:hypothetical protein PoB_003793000 [Plakobranchus ocellatus]